MSASRSGHTAYVRSASDAGLLVEHLVEDLHALVGQPDLVGVGVHEAPADLGGLPRAAPAEPSSPPTYWTGFCTCGSSGSRRGKSDSTALAGPLVRMRQVSLALRDRLHAYGGRRRRRRSRSASSAARGSTTCSRTPARCTSTRRTDRRATRSPSARLGGRQVAFVPRHGRDHRFPPHRVPYRANLWALRSARRAPGGRRLAVGGLDSSLGPGTVVVPDQLVDRTQARADLPRGGCGPRPVRRPVLPRRPGGRPRRGGLGAARTSSTAARSSWSRARGSPAARSRSGTRRSGWSIIGMTALPEAALARELARLLHHRRARHRPRRRGRGR